MPIYIYQHPKTLKTIEIHQSIKATHEYIDDHGVKWNRIFTTPELNTGGSPQAHWNEKDFSEYTGKRKGTMGDLWDQSAELSEKRKKIYVGKDPIKEKYKKDWSKKRNNRKLPNSLN